MRGLAGKRVLVTGGATGVGKAAARRLAEEGAWVAVNYIGEAGPAEAVVDNLAGSFPHGRFAALAADIADDEEVSKPFAQAIQALGGFDALVNNDR